MLQLTKYDDLIAHGLAEDGLVVRNPATSEVVATVRSYRNSELEEVIRLADIAGRVWASRTAKERGSVLLRWYELVLQRSKDLALLATIECGKPLAESLSELTYAASFLQWYAEEGKRAYGDVIPSFAIDKRILTVKQPVGTCAAITPWNFPLAMITRKVGPALAAGCSMIVKPAETTPLCALALEKLALDAGLPEHLFKAVPTTEPAAVGKVLSTHPVIRKLSFTGSTAVGKLLLEQCATTVKRTSMELGGNAPFIVFEDANLDAALDGIMISKFRNAGQTCICANRILVHSAVYDRFVEKFVERVATLNVGNGADAGTTMGPLITDAAVEKVDAMVRAALAAGATLKTGGSRHAKAGQFYQPTVLTDVTPQMLITRAEIFGPVAAVTPFETEEEVVEMANDTPYGLAAYVYSRDIGRIWRMMEALEYGMVGINEGTLGAENIPFGGIKESGLGREGSHEGIDEYLELKYALIGGLGE